jgi:hypothetical protein
VDFVLESLEDAGIEEWRRHRRARRFGGFEVGGACADNRRRVDAESLWHLSLFGANVGGSAPIRERSEDDGVHGFKVGGPAIRGPESICRLVAISGTPGH